MPHSMTGFSTAEARVGPFRLVWEIRSVNHRFLELGFRLPDDLRPSSPIAESSSEPLSSAASRLHLENRRRRARSIADTIAAGALERLRCSKNRCDTCSATRGP